MKTKTIAIAILTLLSFNKAFGDDEIILPVISKPSILEEGTQRHLSDAQIAELLPWAKNSKMFLADLLDGIQNLTMEDKVQRLEMGIKQGVIESAPKNSELLMRYVLNRALVLNETLNQEMDNDAVGTVDVKLRVLTLSIKMALKYYEADLLTLTKKGTPNFSSFGADYFIFLHEVNKSIFDASAQFTVQKIALEWLQWDLYRDINNAALAPKIVKINNAIKQLPLKRQSDAQYIRSIQNLKKTAAQLEILPAADKSSVAVFNEIGSKSKNGYESESDRARRYYFYTSNSQCYLVSESGQAMWNNPVDNDKCAKDGAYYFYTSNSKCYKVSLSGQAMWKDPVDNLLCAKK